MSDEAVTRAAEWRAHWPMVVTTFVGLSLIAVVTHSTGLVIQPIGEEFGWSRTQVTAGMTLALLLSVPLSPVVGALIDKWGVRRFALPRIALTSLSLACIATANGSFVQWLAIWTFYGLVSLMIKATIWTAAITSTFNAARSMALSITLCGSAFTAVVMPPVMQYLTDSVGWREAYVIVSVLWGVPAFLLSWFFLNDSRDRDRIARKASPSLSPARVDNSDVPGLTVREAVRSLALWRIGIATMLMLLMTTGLVVHKVPLLTEVGVSRANAALLVSLSGAAGVIGKIATGWMMERYDAGWVGAFTNAITAVALIFLLEPFQTPMTIVIAMLFVGYAGGTKIQICVYLTGIYAGMKNYGKIFGVMSSIVAAAGGLGPIAAGLAYDVYGGYGAFIVVCIPTSVICGLLIIGLGEYPEWSKSLEASSKRRVPTASAA